MRAMTTAILLAAAAWLQTSQAADPVRFAEHSITEEQTTYQVLLTDVDRDGLTDVVGTTPSPALNTLYWYENPTWERHVLAEDLSEIILWVTHADIDGDGRDEIAALAGFSPQGIQVSTGEIYLLKEGEDVHAPWSAELVDRLQLSHRGTLADFDGDGAFELAVASVAYGPAEHYDVYDGRTPLVFYRTGDWHMSVIRWFDGHLHGMTPVDWDGDGGTDLLSAGLEGICLHQATAGDSGPVWESRQLFPGKQGETPFDRGSSDMRLGHMADGSRFVVAPEPWHSGEIFVYAEQADGTWQRQMIESTLDNGHAIATGDLNGDNNDEIVVGNRTGEMGVFVYYASGEASEPWTRQTLADGSIGGTDCNIADMNGDARPDIVCGGHFSNNIRWYENLGAE